MRMYKGERVKLESHMLGLDQIIKSATASYMAEIKQSTRQALEVQTTDEERNAKKIYNTYFRR